MGLFDDSEPEVPEEVAPPEVEGGLFADSEAESEPEAVAPALPVSTKAPPDEPDFFGDVVESATGAGRPERMGGTGADRRLIGRARGAWSAPLDTASDAALGLLGGAQTFLGGGMLEGPSWLSHAPSEEEYGRPVRTAVDEAHKRSPVAAGTGEFAGELAGLATLGPLMAEAPAATALRRGAQTVRASGLYGAASGLMSSEHGLTDDPVGLLGDAAQSGLVGTALGVPLGIAGEAGSFVASELRDEAALADLRRVASAAPGHSISPTNPTIAQVTRMPGGIPGQAAMMRELGLDTFAPSAMTTHGRTERLMREIGERELGPIREEIGAMGPVPAEDIIGPLRDYARELAASDFHPDRVQAQAVLRQVRAMETGRGWQRLSEGLEEEAATSRTPRSARPRTPRAPRAERPEGARRPPRHVDLVDPPPRPPIPVDITDFGPVGGPRRLGPGEPPLLTSGEPSLRLGEGETPAYIDDAPFQLGSGDAPASAARGGPRHRVVDYDTAERVLRRLGESTAWVDRAGQPVRMGEEVLHRIYSTMRDTLDNIAEERLAQAHGPEVAAAQIEAFRHSRLRYQTARQVHMSTGQQIGRSATSAPIGLLGTTVGSAAGAVGGAAVGAAAAVGHSFLSGRAGGLRATGTETLQRVLSSGGAAQLGDYARVLAPAFLRGGPALAARHLVLSQQDPEYRDMTSRLDEPALDDRVPFAQFLAEDDAASAVE